MSESGIIILMFCISVVLFSVLVGWWARRKGKSAILYFFLSLFLSPMIAAIILQVSLDKKTSEVKEKKKLGIGYKIALVFIILFVILMVLAVNNLI
ncbi:MAG: hypothetical protein V1709_07415 [Planctomycetota bacterium]